MTRQRRVSDHIIVGIVEDIPIRKVSRAVTYILYTLPGLNKWPDAVSRREYSSRTAFVASVELLFPASILKQSAG